MFTNPSTLWIEIIVIIAVVIFLGVLLGIYIYRRSKNLPTGDCAYCHKNKNKLLKEYHKKYGCNCK